MAKLNVGDKVMWSGSFGMAKPIEARVSGIEITNGGKHGDSVDSVYWSDVVGRNVVVDLTNGHWAYASQIKPFKS
jgi:hypothetical protein